MSNGQAKNSTTTERRRDVRVNRRLELVQAFTAVAAVVALIVALVGFSHQLHSQQREQRASIAVIQVARYRAAIDDCLLLRGLVFAATPKGRIQRAEAYINSTSLRNCRQYASALTNP